MCRPGISSSTAEWRLLANLDDAQSARPGANIRSGTDPVPKSSPVLQNLVECIQLGTTPSPPTGYPPVPKHSRSRSSLSGIKPKWRIIRTQIKTEDFMTVFDTTLNDIID